MEQQSWQEVYDFTSTSSSANNTPAPTILSIASEAMPLRGRDISQDENARATPAVQVLDNPPIADRPLMIRTKEDPHLYLSLCYGYVKLLPKPIPSGGSFWYCVKKGGWYGFRNTVSGTFLGHNADGDSICATQGFHSADEYFTVEKDVNGGYIMNVFNSNGSRLIPVSISEDRKSLKSLIPAFTSKDRNSLKSLIQRQERGSAWEFIESK